jgi:hypothetical protein
VALPGFSALIVCSEKYGGSNRLKTFLWLKFEDFVFFNFIVLVLRRGALAQR